MGIISWKLKRLLKIRVPELEKFHVSKVWNNTIIVTQLDQPETVAIEAHPFLDPTYLEQVKKVSQLIALV